MIHATVTYLLVTMCIPAAWQYSQTKRGELRVMLKYGDWHDFTLSVLKCKEVRKIYRDHPYGLKPYHVISPYHFILHNIPIV